MSKDNVIAFNNPESATDCVADTLTALARQGATKMLAKALELEVTAFIEQNQNKLPDSGHNRLIRNGYLPERTVQTGIGDLPVKVPRVRDKDGALKFISSIIPPYMKRSASIEKLLPLLYLKGISTGDSGANIW